MGIKIRQRERLEMNFRGFRPWRLARLC